MEDIRFIMNHPNYKLLFLIKEYLEHKIDTEQFCYQYEGVYNFEVDEDTLEPNLKTELNHLFNIVLRYSSYKEDIEKYDCYYDSDTIRKVVMEFSKKVNLEEKVRKLSE